MHTICTKGFALKCFHSHRYYRIYLLTSPLLHEGDNKWSIVHLNIDLFNSYISNGIIVQTELLNLGQRDHHLWVLLCTDSTNCKSRHFLCFNVAGKMIQAEEKRWFAAQWTFSLLKDIILRIQNIILLICVKVVHCIASYIVKWKFEIYRYSSQR